MTPNPFCALDSRDARQPMFGTATAEKTIWLMLEYARPWGPRAVEQNDLPPEVQGWLDQQLAALPQARLIFIKKDGRPRQKHRFFIAVNTQDDQPGDLYRFELAAYSELTQLNLASLLQDEAMVRPQRVDKPLFLVCTNGKRDRCCTKFGLPIYLALNEALEDPERVWQATHLGGHRYAAVVAAVPAGLTYRLIDPHHDVARLIEAVGRGEIMMKGYRGRSCHAPIVQAADYFLRQETGQSGLTAFRWLQTSAKGQADQFAVAFEQTDGGDRHIVTVHMTQTEPLLASCNSAKFKSQPRFALLGHERLPASQTGGR